MLSIFFESSNYARLKPIRIPRVHWRLTNPVAVVSGEALCACALTVAT